MRLKLPQFPDNQHMKVAKLSALRTDRHKSMVPLRSETESTPKVIVWPE
jgi:hypothetical protein